MQFSGTTPPSSQRSRPIAFVLNNAGEFSEPVVLNIRPEDLTRNEPARAAVHQTLGRNVSGWVDHFGEGLPSVTISGNTGWRNWASSGMDGAQTFDALNTLVVHDFPSARQSAINDGTDPSEVKLLFVDGLDDFAWSVVPTQFTLRRNKSSPLLFRYNINLQAVDTDVDTPIITVPFLGEVSGGLRALDGAVGFIDGLIADVEGLVSKALAFVDGIIGPIAATIKKFVTMANKVFALVNSVVRGVKNFVTGVANRFISMASDIASVGLNVFRTLNAIRNLPSEIKAKLGQAASAFNEMVCIFKNSLRPRTTYEEYTGLYGASNCSSTTGGRPDSAYANMNAFAQMQSEKNVATVNSNALAGIASLKRIDPVLAPMPLPEMDRHLTNVVTGVAL